MDPTLKLIKTTEDVKEELGKDEKYPPSEIRKTKTYVEIENDKKALMKENKILRERVEKLMGGQVVPKKDIEIWREKFFVITQHLDELRDELRKVWGHMADCDLVDRKKHKFKRKKFKL